MNHKGGALVQENLWLHHKKTCVCVCVSTVWRPREKVPSASQEADSHLKWNCPAAASPIPGPSREIALGPGEVRPSASPRPRLWICLLVRGDTSPLLSHFEKMSALLACTSLLSQLLKRFKYVIVNNTGDVLAAVARFSSFYWAPDVTVRSKCVNVPPARCLLSLRSDRERQLSAAPQRLLCYTCLDCERYVLVTNTPSVEKLCLKTLNKNHLAQCFCQFWIHNIIFVSNFKLFNVLPSLCLVGW